MDSALKVLLLKKYVSQEDEVDDLRNRAVKTGLSVQPVTGLVKPVSNRFTVL